MSDDSEELKIEMVVPENPSDALFQDELALAASLDRFKGAVVLKQSNNLTGAVYSLSTAAKRVLWLCLAESKSEEGHPGAFVISAKDYRRVFGGDRAKSARDLYEGIRGADGLARGAGVSFQIKNSRWEDVWYPWVSKVMSLQKGTQHAEYLIVFNPEIFPLMLGLQKEFTLFKLTEVGKLTANQARLYEDCRRWLVKGSFTTTFEDLAERYQFSKTLRDRPAEIERSFLKAACDKINKHTPLLVEYVKDANGGLLFHVAEKKKAIEDKEKAE
ncbi:RepB family plasmid replication initiator protein [Citrobacter portucalensis]|uniref:RepB family plasmid replication initiator protein n=1 Tax=Citrobacter portucalensis TaxID=1639133 RepID=UPI00226B7190|nr:RepB family plasmid replication initiator protein [Citrobacter portucalensis]MCX8985132.1 RepB family plasmid replication initiator protein [Citrobacter portucalensis]